MPNIQNDLPKANESNSSSLPQELVRCTSCGVRLPIGESFLKGGKYYCSEHRSSSKTAPKNKKWYQRWWIGLILVFIIYRLASISQPEQSLPAVVSTTPPVPDSPAVHKNSKALNNTSGIDSSIGDGAFEHCSVFVGYFPALAMWRDTNIPLARVQNTLDHSITDDPPEGPPITQSDLDVINRHEKHKITMAEMNATIEAHRAGLVAWRSAVASTPQDIHDWNTAFESIYNSKVTGQEIEKALKQYCTPHTKHVFRASDLDSIFEQSK